MELVRVLLLLLLTACVCVASGLCACPWGSCGAWAGVVAAAALMFSALWTRAWREEETLPCTGRAVLITGCDSGFGHALALRLSGLGLQVFAGVLDSEGTGAKKLKEQDPERITILQMDVTNAEHIAQVKEAIKKQLGEKELQSTSTVRRIMEVNFLSAVTVTQAFLPLIRRAKGRVVSVSSLAGAVPLPRFSAYSSSKAALSSFCRVLRLEMIQWGVHVALIQPSGFKTKIFGSSEDLSRYRQELLSHTPPEVLQDYGQDYISNLPSSLDTMSQNAMQDVSPVLDCIGHALLSTRPRELYCPGNAAWLLPFLYTHLPTTVFDRIILKFNSDTCHPSALQN
ncbi:estradiol 17-beta-dehydrogenase 2 isoform X2 [Boleophthalmus pectinirostris]|uniref:estradiol 17-beta-dehydrogenase 2 isoform X2 n=1 Tax=Boleophthalmus pectinirostris TaxID=150288 RepID=UPI000A1C59C2|nr:estradiol 17-beta-dehydrogenase 2 isoform X2 [Boleophthalmus pectinirostris]